jgi:pimeloyl-ACP methyl ester carboxylesterase
MRRNIPPKSVDRIVLMEAFLPGVGAWNNVFLLRDLWHFHFFGKTPLALVTGRERIYLEHFWNDFAADAAKSVSEADRRFYAKEYAQPGHMKAGMEVFRAFPKDAEAFAGFAKTKLPMPMLVLSGEKAGGPFLIEHGKMVADHVEGVLIAGRGHWLLEEASDQVIPKLVEFINRQNACRDLRQACDKYKQAGTLVDAHHMVIILQRIDVAIRATAS